MVQCIRCGEDFIPLVRIKPDNDLVANVHFVRKMVCDALPSPHRCCRRRSPSLKLNVTFSFGRLGGGRASFLEALFTHKNIMKTNARLYHLLSRRRRCHFCARRKHTHLPPKYFIMCFSLRRRHRRHRRRWRRGLRASQFFSTVSSKNHHLANAFFPSFFPLVSLFS